MRRKEWTAAQAFSSPALLRSSHYARLIPVLKARQFVPPTPRLDPLIPRV